MDSNGFRGQRHSATPRDGPGETSTINQLHQLENLRRDIIRNLSLESPELHQFSSAVYLVLLWNLCGYLVTSVFVILNGIRSAPGHHKYSGISQRIAQEYECVAKHKRAIFKRPIIVLVSLAFAKLIPCHVLHKGLRCVSVCKYRYNISYNTTNLMQTCSKIC